MNLKEQALRFQSRNTLYIPMENAIEKVLSSEPYDVKVEEN